METPAKPKPIVLRSQKLHQQLLARFSKLSTIRTEQLKECVGITHEAIIYKVDVDSPGKSLTEMLIAAKDFRFELIKLVRQYRESNARLVFDMVVMDEYILLNLYYKTGK